MISRRKVSIIAWCVDCGDRVTMVTAEEAARQIGDSARRFYRRVEAGEVHFTEMNEGLLMICLRSLNGTSFEAGGP